MVVETVYLTIYLFYLSIKEVPLHCFGETISTMQKSLFRLGKIISFSFVLAFFSVYGNDAVASLSTKAATPSQLSQMAHKKANVAASQKVLNVYRQWAGTRYRLGGTTKAGIDCSAFVRTTMSSAFNVHLPRSTAEQRYSGRAIAKSELRPGDLVFFRKNNHVGVYIGDGKFVHAGSSTGVTIASLSDRYWAKTYTQSRRVL